MLTPRKQKSSWTTPQEDPASGRRAGSTPPHAAIPAVGGARPGRQMKTRPTYQLVPRRPPRGTNTKPGANTDVVRPEREPKGPPDGIPQLGPRRQQPHTGDGETQYTPKSANPGPRHRPRNKRKGLAPDEGDEATTRRTSPGRSPAAYND